MWSLLFMPSIGMVLCTISITLFVISPEHEQVNKKRGELNRVDVPIDKHTWINTLLSVDFHLNSITQLHSINWSMTYRPQYNPTHVLFIFWAELCRTETIDCVQKITYFFSKFNLFSWRTLSKSDSLNKIKVSGFGMSRIEAFIDRKSIRIIKTDSLNCSSHHIVNSA